MEEIFKIIELLKQEKAGTLNPVEEEQLQSWKNRAGADKVLEHLNSEEYSEKFLQELNSYDSEKAWKKFNSHHAHSPYLKSFLWAAAVISIFFCTFLFFNQHDTDTGKSETIYAEVKKGNANAILTLPGKKQVILGKEDHLLKGNDNITIKSDSSTLTYHKNDKTNTELAYNELYVPARGEYSLHLSDGSRVYLNACSRLKYPENFGPDERVVELEGEAYFEVASDTTRPFQVKVNGMQIEVLGTSFNVNAYTDHEDVRTTLVNGKVKLSSQNREMLLIPGEQGCVYNKSGYMEKHKVDVSLYTAWKDGLFRFERERLEDILLVLQRWYDVKIYYQDERLKDGLYSGDLKKYENINEHLHMLEMTTNISFDIKGDKIYVGYRN